MSYELFVKNRPVIDSIIKSAEDRIYTMTGLVCDVSARLNNVTPTNEYLYKLLRECCEKWGVSMDFVREKSRADNRPIMRQVYVLVVKMRYPKTQLKPIGEAIGGVDHTTVIHCYEIAKDHLQTRDEKFLAYLKPVEYLMYKSIMEA